MQMVTVYVGIGSNLGDRVGNCLEGAAAMGRLPQTRLLAVSPLYETEPEEGAGPQWFVNAVAALETDLAPETLLAALQRLEALAGRRVERARGKNRTLDLDLLLYGDLVRETPPPALPHPRMHRRRFVLEPICAVAPDALHPRLGRPVRELLAALAPGPAVRPLEAQGSSWGSAAGAVGAVRPA
jgi:2-amino-4-hydroxy-6-hydroxymethyldihydropteridine diphosphokinase